VVPRGQQEGRGNITRSMELIYLQHGLAVQPKPLLLLSLFVASITDVVVYVYVDDVDVF
jgi:hypothetical protein